ncbi:MAG: hypothetical protein HPY53_15270 [Brevinematales bacterium]|nr:hypothetical protein [Brevinematales bacterium]
MKAELSPRVAGFEKYAVGIVAILTGVVLAYLAVSGPFFLNIIHYRTSPSGILQIQGQDIINLFLMAPLLFAAGVTHLLNKKISVYLLILTPVYLIYYALSMGMGIEWGMPAYTGNCEQYTFYFMFLVIAGLLILLKSVSLFPKDKEISLKRIPLIVYSALFVIFICMFASMWVKDIFEVLDKGGSAAYTPAPALFWTIRYLDLGISIPLGFLSVYFLWTRPSSTMSIQFLFYGFFMTTLTAVCSMSVVMYLKNAPDFTVSGMALFFSLAVIVYLGFIYILSALRKGKTATAVSIEKNTGVHRL